MAWCFVPPGVLLLLWVAIEAFDVALRNARHLGDCAYRVERPVDCLTEEVALSVGVRCLMEHGYDTTLMQPREDVVALGEGRRYLRLEPFDCARGSIVFRHQCGCLTVIAQIQVSNVWLHVRLWRGM